MVGSSRSLLQKATEHVGEGAARPGQESDAIDDVRPRLVAEPPTVDAMSSLLAWASAEGLSVGVRGAGTKWGWGHVAGPMDVVVSTGKLARVVEHRHGDLTATVESGVTLAALNAILGKYRQWLPLDPPWSDRATIGGIVATNDSGPSRHRYGAPRDLIIGVTVVRPDGRRAKAGGIVVKNVAGYDLSRLMTGAFGVLGVVVDATFKLVPAAPASRTLLIDVGSIDAMAQVVTSLMSSTLTPSAVEVEWPPGRLLVRFESVKSAVDQQVEEAGRLATSSAPTCEMRTFDGETESELWRTHAGRWDGPGTLLKISTLTDTLFPTLSWLSRICADRDVEMSVQGRAGLGVVDARLDGSSAAQAHVVTELRRRFQVGDGSAVIRRGLPELRRSVDPWGPIGDGLSVMQAIKHRFDPCGVLNRGRGPGGI